MAYLKTTLSSACALTDTSIVVASASNVAVGNRVVVDQEEMIVSQAYASGTTVPVLRGQNGTATAAHASGAGVVQGNGLLDFAQTGAQQNVVSPVRDISLETSQDVTATGATGASAAVVTANAPALVSITGASGSGFGVAIPSGAAMPGAWYMFKNATTGSPIVYAPGATLDGITGVTGITITTTGNKSLGLMCTEAGAWISFGQT